MSKIKKIYTSDDGRPVIAHFQNGTIQPNDTKDLKSALLKREDNSIVVAVENKKTHILYTGNVNRKDDLFNTFIAIHNTRTNKVRLVQADVVTLSPHFKNQENNLNISATEYQKSMSELNKQFGSKRSKTKTEQTERLKMNIDVVKDQLEKTVANITLDESDLATSATVNGNASYYTPNINRNADTREQVYNLQELVPEHVLESLEDAARNALNADSNDNTFELNIFLRGVLDNLNKTDKDAIRKCSLILYVNFVVQFLKTPIMKLKKLVLSNTKSVDDHILDNFSIATKTGRSRPFSMRDKAICYILILLMFVMDFEVPIEKLAVELKIGIKKILEIGRVLAFTIKNKNVLVLKLPLPAPVSFSGSKGKRK